jgi:hypothetical protein
MYCTIRTPAKCLLPECIKAFFAGIKMEAAGTYGEMDPVHTDLPETEIPLGTIGWACWQLSQGQQTGTNNNRKRKFPVHPRKWKFP